VRRLHREPGRGGETSPLLAAAFAAALLVLGAVLLVGGVTFVSRRLGLGEVGALLALWASLLGSFVTIPVARIHSDAPQPVWEVRFLGAAFLLRPVLPQHVTIVAVNVGGALLPVALSTYLLVRSGAWWAALVAVAAVTAVAYLTARIVPGVGIVMPLWIAPLVAALSAVTLAPDHSAAVAYSAAALGTLIGADLLHLRRVARLGATVVSIGGAGTFDGIFLGGIVAVVLAAL
jgi:uncharacterized membrane protein